MVIVDGGDDLGIVRDLDSQTCAPMESLLTRVENRYYAKTMRNALRDFRALEDKAVAAERLPKMVSIIDKLAKRSVIHKNKAANLKSKCMRKVNAM